MAKKAVANDEGVAKTSPEAQTASIAMLDAHPTLKTTVAQIEKQFGEGAIMPLGAGGVHKITGISTGSLSLDMALGGQGIPSGRVVEIFGPESSGKTTLALHVVAQSQRNGGIAAFIDAEHALDPAGPRSWASSWKRCWSASRAAAKRPCTSPKCSSAPTPWT